MTGSNIARASLWGATLIAALLFIAFAAALLLTGCAHVPPGPDPGPSPPVPPGPGATPCERAAARALELPGPEPYTSCTDDAAAFVAACERYEDLGGAFAWNPSCMEQAPTCAALEACRGQR